METMVSTRVTDWRRGCLAAIAFAVLSPTYAGEMEAGVRLGISRTDNALLAASPDEIDDLVYRASPFINYTHESPGLDANLRYRYSWYKYDDLEITESYHMGEGSVTGKFWEESLAIEIGASRAQVLREPEGTIPPGSLPVSENLTDRDEVYINPSLRRKLGRSATVSMDFRHSEGTYDDPLLQDDTNQHGTFSLDNYAVGSGLTWALRYDWRRTEYEISPTWEYQRAWAELGFWAGPTTRIFASGGKESSWDDPFNPSLEDPFWEAGFAYNPNENITAEFAAGERSFGRSARGELEYSFRRGDMALSYVETPTTTGFNQTSGRPIVPDPDDLDEFLDTPGSAERYLSKRLQWNVNLEFRRLNMSFGLFDEDRSDRIRDDGTPLDDQSQRGASVNMTWEAGARTDVYAGGSVTRQELGNDSRSDFYRVGIGANYQLGARTELSLDYSYNKQQPEGESPTGRGYVANVVSLFFTYTM